ncbi:MAG TPA: MraY family glycosyltransferase [Candidatus Binatia bacterium]|nr:MraY family glycosyltransferase [Candidatus Binatia bacterium]
MALLAIGCVALVFSGVTTPMVIWLARRLGALDRPAGYKAHAQPTPLLGGLVIALGLVGGLLWRFPAGGPIGLVGLSALASGSAIILLAGLLDDVRGLAPGHKFVWQVAAAGAAGLSMALLGVRLSLFLPWPPVEIILLTVLWVVGITNAVNFLDNMNGLCAGLGAVAACSLAAINLRSGEHTVAVVSAALAGSCLGFLPYNWPRARIFLGDAGAMLIGFLLAALSVMGVYTRGAHVPVLAVFTPLFVLGIPVLDSVLVVLLRLRIGHPPWVGDRRHISHRLVQRGMHPAAAVATLWAAGAACGLAALLLPTVGAEEAPLLLALLFCALGALAAAAGTRGLS